MDLLQHRKELAFALQIIMNNLQGPMSVLEIGIYEGATFRIWQAISSRNAILVGVDVSDKTGGCFANDKRISLIFGDSHDSMVVKKVKDLFLKEIDLLFIDADHSYEGVKSDHMNYGPLVRKGGVIVFHDTRRKAGPSGLAPHGCGVFAFWRELIDMNVVQEFYEVCCTANSAKQMGTGIIVK